MRHRGRGIFLLASLTLVATLVPARRDAGADEPPPPGQGPPPGYGQPCCPPPPPPPTSYAPAAPRPLSTTAKVLYSPFYATGLVLRYGLYYLLVAPFEVLGRTLAYGARGGVERPPQNYPPPGVAPPEQGP